MARIGGVDLPNEKRVEVALTYIFGIGNALAKKILSAAQVNPDTRVKDLTEEEANKLREAAQAYKVEGEVKSEVSRNIKRLIDIGAYRGLRHKKGLPVRGQRTKTNSRTRKGPRKTVGVVRKKEERRALKTGDK